MINFFLVLTDNRYRSFRGPKIKSKILIVAFDENDGQFRGGRRPSLVSRLFGVGASTKGVSVCARAAAEATREPLGLCRCVLECVLPAHVCVIDSPLLIMMREAGAAARMAASRSRAFPINPATSPCEY